ncbi:MAG TPA: phospholipase D-like domain-containing protein [Ilumatobacteraceae bacterium]|nr:phospholipase D-like domain-containing protein [Ilumatobacteraceae bacterium]
MTTSRLEWTRRLQALLGTPPTEGNRVDVLRNGVEIFPAMLSAIEDARHTVDIVTFVYWRGSIARRVADALADAARRGCRVRVLLDAVGARKLDDELIATMEDAGCDVRWFRPLMDGAVPEIGTANHRTHRKILVCDSSVAFTGGVGIADEWDGDARDADEWRDTHVRIEGPAVAGLQAGFIDNWADQVDDEFDPMAERPWAGGQRGSSRMMVVRGSAETGASELWRMMLTLVSGASERIRIASAYFNPDQRLLEALRQASLRGVEVQILVPGPHADKRFVQIAGEACYAELLDVGVDVRTYDTSMMHAKIVTVDRMIATIGSTNFNQRSTRLDEETNVVIFDRHVVSTLDDHFDDDLRTSTVVDPEQWRDRGPIQRLGERLIGSVSGWL